MIEPLLLDTHIVLWLDSGNDRLLPSTRALVETSRRGGGTVLVSAVTAWEIALFADTERIVLDVSVEAWLRRFVERPGIEAVPLDHLAASRSYRLHNLETRDPADRLLIAAAIERGCPLVTYDARIRRFGERHGRDYGFSVTA